MHDHYSLFTSYLRRSTHMLIMCPGLFASLIMTETSAAFVHQAGLSANKRSILIRCSHSTFLQGLTSCLFFFLLFLVLLRHQPVKTIWSGGVRGRTGVGSGTINHSPWQETGGNALRMSGESAGRRVGPLDKKQAVLSMQMCGK